MALSAPPDVGDQVPNTLWIVVARFAVLAVVVLVVHFGLGEWHGVTLAALIVGAAWLLGRVD